MPKKFHNISDEGSIYKEIKEAALEIAAVYAERQDFLLNYALVKTIKEYLDYYEGTQIKEVLYMLEDKDLLKSSFKHFPSNKTSVAIAKYGYGWIYEITDKGKTEYEITDKGKTEHEGT